MVYPATGLTDSPRFFQCEPLLHRPQRQGYLRHWSQGIPLSPHLVSYLHAMMCGTRCRSRRRNPSSLVASGWSPKVGAMKSRCQTSIIIDCYNICIELHGHKSLYQWIGLRENLQETRKAPYLMGKSMVSCRFSLKPIHWLYWYYLILVIIYLSHSSVHPSLSFSNKLVSQIIEHIKKKNSKKSPNIPQKRVYIYIWIKK